MESGLRQDAPRIVEIPAWTAAGLTIDCIDFDTSQISGLWQKLFPALGGFSDHGGFYGISLPLPGGQNGFRYWAAVKLNEGAEAPQSLQTIVIPAKRFAVFQFSDTPDKIPAAFTDIHINRVKVAGLESSPEGEWVELEYYADDCMDQQTGILTCELYSSIK